MANFFTENSLSSEDFFEALKTACEGLIYISETDAPITPVSGPEAKAVTASLILEYIAKDGDPPVEEKNFDEFFDRLTAVQDWHGDREKEKTKKFLELRQLLEENLGDLKVFRIGRVRIDILVAGLDSGRRLAGIRTTAVET